MRYENGFDWASSPAMSRRSFVALMGLTGAALGLTACDLPFIGGGDGGGSEAESMKSLIVCKSRGSEIFYLDPMLVSSVGATELFNHIMEGLARWQYDDGVLVVKPAIAEPVTDPETGREQLPEPVKNPDGTVTYEYRIREDAVWSDGEPVTADDFVYSWNRCANVEGNASFRDLFDCIAGYSNDPSATLSVYAKDARTLSVTLTKNIPYWNELIAFTPFLPLRADFVNASDDYTWASDYENAPYNGPYKVKSVVVATLASSTDSLVLEKNETYRASAAGPEEIRFVYGRDMETQLQLIENSADELIGQDGAPQSVHILYNVGSDTIEKSKALSDVQRRAVPLLGTEWFIWNVNKVLIPETLGLVGDDYEKAQAEVRKAFCLLMNRGAACSKFFGFKPAASIVPPGMGDAGGADFAANAGSSGGGYYDTSDDAFQSNQQLAIDILRKYYPYDEATEQFTWFVPTIYAEAGGKTLSVPARYFLNTCNELGLHMEYEVNDFTQMSSKHQTGSFEISFSNWYADFTDPITFLSMWTTTSSHNTAQFGRGAHADARIYSLDLSSIGEETRIENGKWSETYDVLIDRIAGESDKTKRFALLHKAEDMVMGTGAVMPIWHPAAAYIIRNDIEGLVSTPFNWMYFGNVREK